MNEYSVIGILLGLLVALVLERVLDWLLSPIDRWLANWAERVEAQEILDRHPDMLDEKGKD